MSAARPGERPAVFLDRDGTINVEVEGALKDPAQLELLPGVGPAIARLNRAGYAVCCVTNQSAIGRGWMTTEDYERVAAALEAELARSGARLDLCLYCPDHPTEGLGEYRRDSRDRKPGPGLFEKAGRTLGLDPAASWVVGDAGRDLAAGQAFGARAILVATGKGRGEYERLAALGSAPEVWLPDLAAAVDWILARDGRCERAQGR